MKDYERELAWKNHAPFFVNLNKDLDKLREISKLTNDLQKVPDYFRELDNVAMHYSCYMDPQIFTDLDKQSEILITIKYQKFLKNINNPDPEYYQKILDCIKNLKKIHKNIMICLHNNDLFPKPTTKKIKNKGKALIE